MLISLWAISQCALLTLAVALGTSLAWAPGDSLLIAAAGALALVPLAVSWILAIRTAYSRLPFATVRKAVGRAHRDVQVAEDPGAPGSSRPRAPTQVAGALV